MTRNSLPLITTPKAVWGVLQANVKAGFPYRVVAERCASRYSSVHIIDKGVGISSKCRRSQQLGDDSIFPLGYGGITYFMVNAVQNDLRATMAGSGRVVHFVGTGGEIGQRWQTSRPVLLATCPSIPLRTQTTPIAASSYSYRQFSSFKKSAQDTYSCPDSSEMSEPSSAPEDDKAAFEISPDRKAAFVKARKTGITRRLLEGGGVPRNLDLSSYGHNAPIEIDKTILDAVWEEDGANFGDRQSIGMHEETCQIQPSTSKGNANSSLSISNDAIEQRGDAGDAEVRGSIEIDGDMVRDVLHATPDGYFQVSSTWLISQSLVL